MAPESSKTVMAANAAALSNRISTNLAARMNFLQKMKPPSLELAPAQKQSLSSARQQQQQPAYEDEDEDDSYSAPNTGLGHRGDSKEETADEQQNQMLRRKVLGKRAAEQKQQQQRRRAQGEVQSDSDEDVGRSALGKRKRPRREPQPEPEPQLQDEVPPSATEDVAKEDDFILEAGSGQGKMGADNGTIEAASTQPSKKKKNKKKKKKKPANQAGDLSAAPEAGE
ncbi:hypothetical protein B0I35DRAFT_232053 [Stachybotrys elegans]|uniref:Uncharacterized protein n=1 Tax=Stachybotrys elegans TaxID=80388 RepID=A0A8K0WTE6_9HYPO|nr:hypothetical protein B0I35DRAFT_232053 [Stachybotrys elegans]